MPKYTLYLKDDPTTVQKVPPGNYSPGDQLLLIERPLLDDATLLNQVGKLIARLTVMKIATNGKPLILGNADHHLDKGLHPGMICVQASWTFGDTHREFAIIGGTKAWRAARGTVTFSDIAGSTNERLDYNWH